MKFLTAQKLPVTAKHINEFEINNTEPNDKEDGSSKEGILKRNFTF